MTLPIRTFLPFKDIERFMRQECERRKRDEVEVATVEKLQEQLRSLSQTIDEMVDDDIRDLILRLMTLAYDIGAECNLTSAQRARAERDFEGWKKYQSREHGEKGALSQKEKEAAWKAKALPVLKDVRRKNPTLTQQDLAERTRKKVPECPGAPLITYISQLEKNGSLAKRSA